MLDLYKNIRKRRNELGLTQTELAHRLGYSDKSMIAKIEGGKVDLSQSKIMAFAEALNTSASALMGWDDDAPAAPSVPGAIPLTKKKIPLLGRVACGVPIYSEEEHEVWLPVDIELDAAFAVLAVGDSMIGAGIRDGDHVFIRPQPAVDNGTIALVAIGDEYTLKRVYYYPDKHKLILNPENPAYEPLIYSDRELENVRIIGKFIGFLHLEE